MITLVLPSQAQNDSPYTDTVIVEQPPVIITREVHVSALTEEPTKTPRWDLGAYYLYQQNLLSDPEIKVGAFQSGVFQARYHLGNVELGLGIGIFSSKASGQV